jgi:hypothetical protein
MFLLRPQSVLTPPFWKQYGGNHLIFSRHFASSLYRTLGRNNMASTTTITTANHQRTTDNPLLDLFLRTNDANDGVPRLDSSIWEFLTVRDLCRLRSCLRTIYNSPELVEYNRCRDGRGEKSIVHTHTADITATLSSVFCSFYIKKLRIHHIISSRHPLIPTPILSCGNKITSSHFRDIPACSRQSLT